MLWLSIAIFIAILVVLEIVHMNWVPSVEVSSNYYFSNTNRWLGGTAEDVKYVREYLNALVDMGPRVTGTVQLQTATHYLLHTLEELRASASSDIVVEVELQQPSGHFDTEFLDGFTNVYRNVSNVVVRIYSRALQHTITDQTPSLLVNAHYDTVPTSAGASDDALGCAVMLAAIRWLTRSTSGTTGGGRRSRPAALSLPLVFLFNGAEESHQTAAHGFIAQHRWAQGVRYLVNLEAIGGGGRELVFQCNSAHFIQLYARSVPYPKGSVVAHELFKAVLWKSAATDWRTFIRHSPNSQGVIGIDSAYINNGQIYHTMQDDTSFISTGTVVNTLSNLLGLLEGVQQPHVSSSGSQLPAAGNMRSRHSMDTPAPLIHSTSTPSTTSSTTSTSRGDEQSVFFTIPGLFFVAYSGSFSVWLHSFVGMVGILYCVSSGLLTLTAICTELFLFVAALVTGVSCGALYSIIAPMRWYAGGLPVACLLYCPPCVAVLLWLKTRSLASHMLQLSPLTANTNTISKPSPLTSTAARDYDYVPLVSQHETAKRSLSADPCYAYSRRCLIALVFSWSVVLLLCVYCGVMSGYLAGFLLTFTMLGDVAYKIMRVRSGGAGAVCVYLACVSPALLHWLELLHGLLLMLLPLMGKAGTIVPPDIVVGLVVAALTSVLTQISCVHLVRRATTRRDQSTIPYLRAACAVYVLLVIVAAVYLPAYTALFPKRLWLQHITRERCTSLLSSSSTACEVDSGLWLTAFDGQGLRPLRTAGIKKFDGRYSVPACVPGDGSCYALFPWSYPVAHLMRDSFYIPATPPAIPEDRRLTLTATSIRDDNDTATTVTRGEGVGVGDIEGVITRSITVSVSGSTHLRLIVRDGAAGGRLLCWDLGDGVCVSPPAPRFDGSRYVQLLCGASEEVCRYNLLLRVRGQEAVEVTAHADYVSMRDTPELAELRDSLPLWARGAEWTNFASSLISRLV